MTIDEAKRFLELLSQKTQSGGFTPEQFNLAADRAQMQLLEKDYKLWQTSKELTEAISDFVEDDVPFAVPVATGKVNYPSNFMHTVDVRRYYAQRQTQIPCEEVRGKDVGEMMISQLNQATLRFPKYVERDLHWQFYPKDVGNIIIDYIRRPTVPVWGYTMQNGRAVYNPSTSTQFEFPDFAHNEIVGIMCSYLSINIREGMLMEYAEMFKEQNKQG